MVRVGIAGLGFMGMIHYLAYQKIKGVKVVALCEVDPVKLGGDWTGIKGNFGPPGQQMDLSGISKHTTLEELLANPKVDVVDLCLPPSAHAAATLTALAAGKHVFCEKPIALNRRDAQRMLAAAKKAGRQLLIGHVLPFFPEFQFAYDAVRSGKYGKLLGGQFRRVISDPTWLRDFWNPEKVGGPMLDLHVHDAHFIRLIAGMPRSVATIGRMRGAVAEFFTSSFRFDDPQVSITATSGAIRQAGRSFNHGYEMQFERATILFEFAVIGDQGETLMPVTVLTADGKVHRPKFAAADPTDAFLAELKEVVRSIKTGKPSPILDGELACDALRLCERQTESLAKQREVKVD